MVKTQKPLIEGSIFRNLLRLALPTMTGFACQMAYDLADLAWIGLISSKALAGVTIFSVMFWLVNVLNEIIGTSSVSLISQSYGKGDQEHTSLCIEQTLTFKAIVAIIAGVLFAFLLNPLLGFFTQDPEVARAALDYGYIRIFFLPILFSTYTLNTAFRCVGNGKIPMYLMMISAILNIVLDPILMFEEVPFIGIPGFGLGVFGAALATVISVVVIFLVGAAIVLLERTPVKIRWRHLFKLNWAIDRRLILIGLPSGAEVLMRNVAGIMVLKFVSSYGTEAVAAMGIGSRLLEFCFMPLLGLTMACSAIVGQCIGAGALPRARATVKMAVIIGLASVAVAAVVVIIFPDAIMGVFVQDAAVIAIGTPMLRILIPGLAFAAVLMGIGGAFSGAGYNKPFVIASLVGKFTVQLPLLLIAVVWLKLPVISVWVTFVAADFAEMLVGIWFYKKGRWASHEVL